MAHPAPVVQWAAPAVVADTQVELALPGHREKEILVVIPLGHHRAVVAALVAQEHLLRHQAVAVPPQEWGRAHQVP